MFEFRYGFLEYEQYFKNDVVTLDGRAYICIQDVYNEFPDNTTYWSVLAEKGAAGPQGIKGDRGDQGIQGLTGNPGTNGLGVPAGGTTNQMLTKLSNADNHSGWVTFAGGGDMMKSVYDPGSTGVVAYAEDSTLLNGADATYFLNRLNHSGTIPAATISDFATAVGATAAVTGKQATLVSGTNIKTVNSTSLLGSGNVAVQATLVSGTNIKSINGVTLLGSGDMTVGGSLTGVVTNALAAYTLVLGDANGYLRNTSASASIVTVPPNSAVAFPIGTTITVSRSNTGTVTLAAGAGVTLASLNNYKQIDGQYASVTLVKVATDSWDLMGALIA